MDDNAIHQCQCPVCLGDTNHSQRLLHEQMNLLLQRLDEQERRWVAGLESKKIGYGGDTIVACITGLRVNVKRLTGPYHPDRDTQFRYLGSLVELFGEEGWPILSVDAKKKELVVGRQLRQPRSDLAAGPLRGQCPRFLDGCAIPRGSL